MPNIGETQEAMTRPGPGWLECIGLSVRRDEFPELFEKLGSRHGALNATHFNLPSEAYTYIYAGGKADKIGETLPSVPGESVRMVPVDVPPSPIMSMAMEPRGVSVGPEDTMPGTRLRGGAPGSIAETEVAYARVRTPAEARGDDRAEDLQGDAEKAAVKATEAQATTSPTESRRSPAVADAVDSQKAQRAAADARVKPGPKAD